MLGLHKQVVNRVLEAYQWMNTIVTSTEWDNFFELRCHPDAQPEFQHLACMMRDAMASSTPILRHMDDNGWHLPYISDEERTQFWPVELTKISAARCARVSYTLHDGTAPSTEKDLGLFERLVGAKPGHMSPCEHQSFPSDDADYQSRNFRGWHQFREVWERDAD